MFSGLLRASIEAKKGGDKRPTFLISFKEHCFTTNYVKNILQKNVFTVMVML